jgi:hypothetical protein
MKSPEMQVLRLPFATLRVAQNDNFMGCDPFYGMRSFDSVWRKQRAKLCSGRQRDRGAFLQGRINKLQRKKAALGGAAAGVN